MNGFEDFLLELVQSPERHAKFLNTLSMLEYMGARKIFKSQRAETLNISVLNHAADEIRHARLLKKAALDLSDGRLEGYQEEELLCGQAARAYFQIVDCLGDELSIHLTSHQKYVVTTWLVERRALWVYPIYERILARSEQFRAQKMIVQAILKDEERHMDHVHQYLSRELGLSDQVLEEMKQGEENGFQDIANAWYSIGYIA